MEKKQIDWSSIGFGYIPTEKRYVSNYKDGKWDDGCLTEDANIVLNECAGVLQYSQSVFEGMKAYTTEDGRIVVFRPDMNAKRFADSARRLEMPVFPEDRFVDAIVQVVKANDVLEFQIYLFFTIFAKERPKTQNIKTDGIQRVDRKTPQHPQILGACGAA